MIEEKQDIKSQLISLRSYSKIIIITMCLLMCAGLVSVDLMLNTKEKAIENVNEGIHNYTNAQLSGFDRYIEEHERNIQLLTSLIEKELLVGTDGSNGKVLELLEEVYINNGYLYTYVGLENKEMLLIPEDDLPDGYDPTERPWYIEAAEGEIVWSSPYNDAATGDVIISLSSPLMDRSTDELIGVLSYDIGLNELLDEVMEWGVTDSGYFIVADDSGIILIHPDQMLIGQMIPIQEINEYIIEKSSGVVKYDFNGVEKVANIVYHELSGFTIIHNDEIVSNGLTAFTLISLVVVIISSLLMLLLITIKISNIKKRLNEETQLSNYSHTNTTTPQDKIKIKRISEELSKVAAELDGLS